MVRRTLIFIAVFLFGASLLSVLGYQFHHPQSVVVTLPQNTQYTPCKAIYVYDGDTFACDLNGDGHISGQFEHIRLLGINATEMHYSPENHSGKDEPFALAAKQFVEKAVLHRMVYLSFDQQRIDKYHRTLAYVYLDPLGKVMLNEVLLEKGLAKTFFMGVDQRYDDRFLQDEQQAQSHHLALWSLPTS